MKNYIFIHFLAVAFSDGVLPECPCWDKRECWTKEGVKASNESCYGSVTLHSCPEQNVKELYEGNMRCMVTVETLLNVTDANYQNKVMVTSSYRPETAHTSCVSRDADVNKNTKLDKIPYMDYFIRTRDHIGLLWDGQGKNDASFCCPDGLTFKKFKNSNKNEDDKKEYLEAYRECLENEFTNPEILYEEARRTLETISFKPFWERNINEISILIVVFVIICLLSFMFYCFLASVKQKKNHRKMVGEMEEQRLRELERPRREANRKLGEGGYGEVYEGTYRNEPVAIKIVPAKFASEEKKYRSLTTECTIMAAFRNPFILSHKYPEISKFFGPRETDFIPEVAFEKYGWSDGSGKRHLMDLLYFMTDMVNNIKSDQYQLKMYKQQNEETINEADYETLSINIANLNHMRAQRNHDIIGIGWKVIGSIFEGLKVLHKGQTDTDRGVQMPQWRSYINSVVHRDLKPQNIGIKVNADGQFYAVLADFGLAYCLLSESACKIKKRLYGEKILEWINRPIQWFNKKVFYATLDSNFSLDQAIISFLQRNETDMVTNFHGKRFAGSLQWRAPEYTQGQKYYFKKPPNYWCHDCMSRDSDRGFNGGGGYTAGRSSSYSSRTTNQSSRTQGVGTQGERMGVFSNFSFKCINCKEKVIFDYYKKADIYAAGLVSWCIFKTIHQCVFEDVISPTTPIQDAFHGNNDESGDHNRYDRLSEAVNSPAIMIQIEDKIEDPTDRTILKTMLKFTRECLNQNPHERPTAENVCKEFLLER